MTVRRPHSSKVFSRDGTFRYLWEAVRVHNSDVCRSELPSQESACSPLLADERNTSLLRCGVDQIDSQKVVPFNSQNS